MRSPRPLALAFAAGLCAGCAPGAAISPSPVREAVRTPPVDQVVAGVVVRPSRPAFPKRIVFRMNTPRSSTPRPLMVVDGRLLKRAPESLDPREIEKIHILRNPAATKRYGMRAAGGAVLISTRRR